MNSVLKSVASVIAYSCLANAEVPVNFPDTLKLSNGKTYQDVKLMSVKKNEIRIMHSGGIASINIDALPEEAMALLKTERPEVVFPMKEWGNGILSAPLATIVFANQAFKVQNHQDGSPEVRMTMLFNGHPSGMELAQVGNNYNFQKDKVHYFCAPAQASRNLGVVTVIPKIPLKAASAIDLPIAQYSWREIAQGQNGFGAQVQIKNDTNINLSFRLTNSQLAYDRFISDGLKFEIPDSKINLPDANLERIVLCFAFRNLCNFKHEKIEGNRPTFKLPYKDTTHNFTANAELLAISVVADARKKNDGIQGQVDALNKLASPITGDVLFGMEKPENDLIHLAFVKIQD